MLNGKKVYAVVPVRGGSKGIPRKNLYRLGKDTLLERTIKLAQRCSFIDETVVSTDDPEMQAVAARYQAAAPTLRPAALANDTALTMDVILHLMDQLKINDAYILLLQTTSPLRTLADLNSLFATFQSSLDKADSIVSVTLHDSPHPNKVQKVNREGYLESYLGGESMVPRQSLPVVYSLNGAFYLTHSEILKSQRTFFPKRTLPFVMPEERSQNLDSKWDLIFLETMLEKGLLTMEEYVG